ncbi:MAG TPA: hypothetical protein VHG93_21600 [Longimicrobium sp.]|nr:hypothetical protein [Longimicrobium sp.]
MNTVLTTGDYVTEGRDAVIEVVVGEGQQGEIRVRHNGRVVAEGSGRVRARLSPGTGSVRAKAIVNHTNGGTTAASVTYRFTGGPAPDEFRGDGDFSAGEPIEFRGEFTLS